jgi:hypothetical protein
MQHPKRRFPDRSAAFGLTPTAFALTYVNAVLAAPLWSSGNCTQRISGQQACIGPLCVACWSVLTALAMAASLLFGAERVTGGSRATNNCTVTVRRRRVKGMLVSVQVESRDRGKEKSG